MRLNAPAMAVAFGILWGACLLVVGVANMIWPSYGQAFLQLCASIYPCVYRKPKPECNGDEVRQGWGVI
jgi:hypothetical protein